MLRIGLTGGIGSGKTAVSNRFEQLGVPIIDTDILAREVVEPGEPALGELVTAFGAAILQPDGTLDRARLRDLAFATPEARRKMESILHPAIRHRLDEKLAEFSRREFPYCVIVVPLLVETEFQELVDRVLVVEASRERRIQWVMARSGLNRDEIERIMNTQATSEQRLQVAHDVIRNDGTLDDLSEEVDRLHAAYLTAAEGR